MRIRALILMVSCITAVSARSISYTSTEQEALRVLSKHKALFTLIPQRVAEILKVVRLHSHAEPAQRLDIVYETIKHVQGKYHIIAQIRDAVKRTRSDMAPYIREGINNQFKELSSRLKKYKKTLKTTLHVLDDEVGKLVIAAGGSKPKRRPGRAFKAARAVLATNQIDTLVDTLAGRDESAPTEQTSVITQMSRQISQLRDQIATITESVAQGARDMTYDFAQKLAAMSAKHTAAFGSLNEEHNVIEQEYAERQSEERAELMRYHASLEREREAREAAEKAEKKRLKKEKKRLEKEAKQRKKEEERQQKAEEERKEREEEARKKAEKEEKKRKKEEKERREQEEKDRRKKEEKEEEERQDRLRREQEERERYEREEQKLLAEEERVIREYDEALLAERERQERIDREERELRVKEEQRWREQQAERERERSARERREQDEKERAEREVRAQEESVRLAKEEAERFEREERERREREEHELFIREEELRLAQESRELQEQEDIARAEREEALLMEREEREERERQERFEREERERADKDRRDREKREWHEERDRRKKAEENAAPARVLRQEVASDVLTGYRWVRDRVGRAAQFVVAVPRAAFSGVRRGYNAVVDFWTLKPVPQEKVVKAQVQADALISTVSDGVKGAYRTARDGVVRGVTQAHPAMMSGGMLGGQMAQAGSWSLAGRMKSASVLDPSRVIEQPLLPADVQASYEKVVAASGEAAGKVQNRVKAALSSVQHAVNSAGSAVASVGRRAWGAVASHPAALNTPLQKKAAKARAMVQQHQSLRKHGYEKPIAVVHKKITPAANIDAATMRMGAHTETRTLIQRGLDTISGLSASFAQIAHNTVEAVGTVIFRAFTFIWDLAGSLADLFRSGTSAAVARARELSSHGILALRNTSVRVGSQTKQFAQEIETRREYEAAQVVDEEIEMKEDPFQDQVSMKHAEKRAGVNSVASPAPTPAPVTSAQPYTVVDATKAYWNAVVRLPAAAGAAVARAVTKAKDAIISTTTSAGTTAVGTARAVGAQVHGVGRRISGVGETGLTVMQRGWNAVHAVGQKLGTAVSSSMHGTADAMKQAKLGARGKKVVLRGMHAVTDKVSAVKGWFTGGLTRVANAAGAVKDSVVQLVQSGVARLRGSTDKQATKPTTKPAYVQRRDGREGMKRMQKLVRVRSTQDLRAVVHGLPSENMLA